MSLSFSSSEVRALFSETSNSLMFFHGCFSVFRSLDCAVEIDFCHRQFARGLIVFLIRILGDHLSLGEIQLEFCDFVLVVHIQVV